MNPGTIVKAYIPQSDGLYKPRPAVLIRKLPYYRDWLIVGISSKVHRTVADFDIVIDVSHPDFELSGLDRPSVIRCGWITFIPESRIEGGIGSLGPKTFDELQRRLTELVSGSRR